MKKQEEIRESVYRLANIKEKAVLLSLSVEILDSEREDQQSTSESETDNYSSENDNEFTGEIFSRITRGDNNKISPTNEQHASYDNNQREQPAELLTNTQKATAESVCLLNAQKRLELLKENSFN